MLECAGLQGRNPCFRARIVRHGWPPRTHAPIPAARLPRPIPAARLPRPSPAALARPSPRTYERHVSCHVCRVAEQVHVAQGSHPGADEGLRVCHAAPHVVAVLVVALRVWVNMGVCGLSGHGWAVGREAVAGTWKGGWPSSRGAAATVGQVSRCEPQLRHMFLRWRAVGTVTRT